MGVFKHGGYTLNLYVLSFFSYGNKMIRKLWNLGWTTGLSNDPCVLHNPGFQTLRWWFREDFSYFMIFPVFSPYFSNIFPWFSWVGHFRRFFPDFFPDFFPVFGGSPAKAGSLVVPQTWRFVGSWVGEVERDLRSGPAYQQLKNMIFKRWISHIYVKW